MTLFAVGAMESQVKIVTDLAYLEDAGYADDKDKLDVYQPSEAAGAPVFVFIHGGGLLQGDKDQQGHVGRFFAEHGFVTVCISHRLSPLVSHPAHAEDAAAALRWVAENISDYGGDPLRIAVGGHSAGAYLAALVALDPRYLRDAGSSVDVIQALVPISGFFWVERLAPSRPKTVWGEDEADWREASPGRYVSRDSPATLLVWADGDVDDRRKESRDLAAALRHAGADRVEETEIADRDHGSVWRRIGSEGDATGKSVVEFLNSVL
jgi:acetyl esterase/lipase